MTTNIADVPGRVTVHLGATPGSHTVAVDGHDITNLVRADTLRIGTNNGYPVVELEFMPGVISVDVVDAKLVVDRGPRLKALDVLAANGIHGSDATTALDTLIRRLVKYMTERNPDAVVKVVGSDAIRAYAVLAAKGD